MLELNKLYCCDCMEGMAQFPDQYFSVAIVDPPYGVGGITYMPHKRIKAIGGFLDEYNIVVATLDMAQRSNVKSKYLTDTCHGKVGAKTIKDFGDENVAPGPEYFKELFRVSRHQIIWGGNNYILPPSRNYVVWRKTTVAEKFSMAMCEYAWVSINGNAKYFECAPQGTKDDPRLHPAQKPIALYKWLLKQYANPGDKILDTHVGSASSLIACYDGGYDFIGFEINQNYYDAAKKRLDNAMAQKRMYEPDTTQSSLMFVDKGDDYERRL